MVSALQRNDRRPDCPCPSQHHHFLLLHKPTGLPNGETDEEAIWRKKAHIRLRFTTALICGSRRRLFTCGLSSSSPSSALPFSCQTSSCTQSFGFARRTLVLHPLPFTQSLSDSFSHQSTSAPNEVVLWFCSLFCICTFCLNVEGIQ